MITGAAGNLGHAVAARYHRAGDRLILLDRSTEKLAAVFPELASSTDHQLIGEVDLTDADSVSRSVAAALGETGRIDVLVNTVGFFRESPLVEDLDLFEQVFRVNVMTTVHSIRAALSAMLERGRGSIVNIASDSGLAGLPRQAAYSASKSALLRISESLAAELAPRGIRVNTILPGTMDTPRNRQALPDTPLVPLDAVADAIYFLGSDASRAITGVALPVRGRGRAPRDLQGPRASEPSARSAVAKRSSP